MKYIVALLLTLSPIKAHACGADCQRQMQENLREINRQNQERVREHNERVEQERRMREMLEQSRTYK